MQEFSSFLLLGECKKPIICSDNQPAIDAVLNGKGRTKHYDLRIKFLSTGMVQGMFAILKVSTRDNLADIFTKVLRAVRFRMFNLVSALVRVESPSKADRAVQIPKGAI